MKELLELNSRNLKKGYFWIIGFLNLIFITLLIFFHSEISLKWILIIFSGTLIILPLIVLSAWSFDWYKNRRNYNRIYCKKPYRNLKEIGFYYREKSIIHANGMIDYVYFSRINNWEIHFTVSFLKPKNVTFSLYGKIPDFKKSKSKFEKLNIEKFEIDRYAILWNINTKKENTITLNFIEKKLNSMIELAEKINCEQILTSDYEKVLNTTTYKKNCW